MSFGTPSGRALDTVLDPELDEPITDSRVRQVVHRVRDRRGVATVRLRLPTFFCSPNFSWLMVADAYDAVSAVPGVTRADIALEDHFVSEEINEGVAARSGFVAALPGRGRGRSSTTCAATFYRKAALAGQERVARPLVDAGATPEELAQLRLGQVPPSPDLDRLRARRADGGAAARRRRAAAAARRTVSRSPPPQVPLHLRRARLTGVSIEANGGTCRDLLAKRYAATS